MKSRMITLFGEQELIPEELRGAPKPAARPARSKTAVAPVNWESWTPEKNYYSIGEVAGLFGVRTSHIRFWTTEFELKVRTTQKGDRLYTPQNIEALRAIHHLIKERGFTISGAKAKLKEPHDASLHTLDLRQSLLKLRNQLLIIRNKLA